MYWKLSQGTRIFIIQKIIISNVFIEKLFNSMESNTEIRVCTKTPVTREKKNRVREILKHNIS